MRARGCPSGPACAKIHHRWLGGRTGEPPSCAKEGCALAYLVAGVGYVGAKLAEDLLAAGKVVVGIDNYFSSDPRALAQLRRQPRFHFVRGSIASRQTLARAFAQAPVEVVFALAAQASAHADAASARYTEITNLLAPRTLIEESLARGVRAVVFGSSLRVYGDLPPTLAAEDAPYGRFGDLSHLSKVYVEKLLEMYAGHGGLRCIAVRLGLVYGVGPVMKTDYRFLTAPNKFCLQAIRGERVVVDAGGLRPHGLLHVADAARALLLAAGVPGLPDYCVVNAATEVATMRRVAHLVADEAARLGLAVRVEAPPGADEGDGGQVPSRLAQVGFRASRSLVDGIRETLAYYQRVEAAGRRS